MKTIIIAIAVLTASVFPVSVYAQSTVPWSGNSTGFGISYSTTSTVKSAVGQGFVGTVVGSASIVESGFLADTLMRGTVVRVADNLSVPTEYALRQNFPNPFNPSTTIVFELPAKTMVRLTAYDLLGREIATLVDEDKTAGVYEVLFDASRMASGVYFYRLEAGGYCATKRMVILK
jgi:hypothetical protein